MRPIIFFTTIAANTLEYFDFLLFVHFSFLLTPLFFPSSNPTSSSIATLGLFAVAFFARPIGGLFFGSIGDQLGRKKSLTRSILWISLPTFCIGCVPTYQEIGIVSGIIVIVCRMLQGLSIGGESSNAGIFLMEHAEEKKRGFYSGLLGASSALGSLMAIGCVYLVLQTSTYEWAWRIPFLLSSFFGILAYKFRQNLSETPEYLNLSKISTQRNKTKQIATWKDILSKKRAFATIVGISALGGVLIWIPMIYTNFYLTKTVEWEAIQSISMVAFAVLNYFISLIFMGYLGGYLGTHNVMRFAAFITIFCAYPLFYALTSGHVILAQVGFSLLAGTFSSGIHAVGITLFPIAERSRAISVGYSIGVSLGGLSPIIAAFLVNWTGDELSPALYVILIAILGLLTMLYYKPFEVLSNKQVALNR